MLSVNYLITAMLQCNVFIAIFIFVKHTLSSVHNLIDFCMQVCFFMQIEVTTIG